MKIIAQRGKYVIDEGHSVANKKDRFSMKCFVLHHWWLSWACSLFAALILFGDSFSYKATAATDAGGIVTNFIITNYNTGQPLQLFDYQGTVILLFYWQYWCGNAQQAAPSVETNIVQYYRNLGGNFYGVPVTVISISVDFKNSDPTSVTNFINSYGQELVGIDSVWACDQFAVDGIPYFVVINGTTNSPNFLPWQVAYCEAGYSLSDLRLAIDSVAGTSPRITTTSPLVSGVVADAYNLTLQAVGGRAPYDFSVVSNSLPSWLNLSSGGDLTGTPTEEGVYNLAIVVTDANTVS